MHVTEFWHKDKYGHTRPNLLVDKTFFHPKSQRLYSVSEVVFDAERELWMVKYNRVGDLAAEFHFVHTLTDFQREGRFVEVKND